MIVYQVQASLRRRLVNHQALTKRWSFANAHCACLHGLLFTAPAAVAQTPAATEMPQPAMVYSDQSPAYRFFPGDEVEVTIFSAPELSRSATIGPDGRLALPLIGAVRAADLTAEELRDILVSAYSVHLRMPELTVTPRTYASRQVFVGGEVARPGIYGMPANIDAFQASARRRLPSQRASQRRPRALACERFDFGD
ncbi:MAG: polysaccharide export protein [Caulobacteraceae bacterium]|nr:polysaccharide export protein [Caulobacteraceae bacterium]